MKTLSIVLSNIENSTSGTKEGIYIAIGVVIILLVCYLLPDLNKPKK
jgi:hypothetical protein